MKTLILDGSHPNDGMGSQIGHVLLHQLGKRGWEAEVIPLSRRKIGNCAGEFFCWVRNPGICNINDDNRLIAEKIVQADLLVFLTPVTFGGYSSVLKRMVDHMIQNVLPFFTRREGEIHHQRRYPSRHKLLVIGWTDSPEPQAEAVFRHLVKRNAINLHAPTVVCGVVSSPAREAQLAIQVEAWLKDIDRGKSSPTPGLQVSSLPAAGSGPVQRALLLIGSPRTRKSTSASLGGYLMEQLAARRVQTETIQVYTSLYSSERMRSMLEAIDKADLLVLAFPLYVDGLPGPLVAALEKIAIQRAGQSSTQRMAAIVNCGFPEASHMDAALEICEIFARQAGFLWSGGLALGGGQGLVHGAALDELDRRALPIKRSLEAAAMALTTGKPIPQAARDLMAKPIIPGWLYQLAGVYGWKQQAKRYGMQKQLKRRPYWIGAEREIKP